MKPVLLPESGYFRELGDASRKIKYNLINQYVIIYFNIWVPLKRDLYNWVDSVSAA